MTSYLICWINWINFFISSVLWYFKNKMTKGDVLNCLSSQTQRNWKDNAWVWIILRTNTSILFVSDQQSCTKSWSIMLVNICCFWFISHLHQHILFPILRKLTTNQYLSNLNLLIKCICGNSSSLWMKFKQPRTNHWFHVVNSIQSLIVNTCCGYDNNWQTPFS